MPRHKMNCRFYEKKKVSDGKLPFLSRPLERGQVFTTTLFINGKSYPPKGLIQFIILWIKQMKVLKRLS